MKKPFSSIKKKSISRYLLEDISFKTPKSTNINILLNRVKSEKKNTQIKRFTFYVLAIFTVCLLGTLIF